jgi:hypothetical protein
VLPIKSRNPASAAIDCRMSQLMRFPHGSLRRRLANLYKPFRHEDVGGGSSIAKVPGKTMTLTPRAQWTILGSWQSTNEQGAALWITSLSPETETL